MMRTRLAVSALALCLVFGANVPRAGESWKVEAIHTLADVQLATFLGAFGITVPDDHGIKLGGIGSDLFREPGDGPGTMWMLTDRGPNGEIPQRTFPVDNFTPFILKVEFGEGTTDIVEAIPITDGLGNGVTGLSNLPVIDEAPFDCRGTTPLAYNPEGLDSEGLVRLQNGTFWVAEEYSPSLVHVAADGRVIGRFVPEGLNLGAAVSYPVIDTLPGILARRKINRGFEGLTISPDHHTLYVVVQSPLFNPNSTVGNASRQTRILGVDPDSGEAVSEYVYQFDIATEYGAGVRPRDMKISALTMLDSRRMLVLERTDDVARIYLVDLNSATDILGSKWDQASTTPSLETLADDTALTANGIVRLPKQLVLELDSADGFPKKIEGMAVLDGKTIAIANDNDFGIGSFDMSGGGCQLIDTGNKSTVQIIRLDKPIR
jgi:hypothetical protein